MDVKWYPMAGRAVDYACLEPCLSILRRLQPAPPSPAALQTQFLATSTGSGAAAAAAAAAAREETLNLHRELPNGRRMGMRDSESSSLRPPRLVHPPLAFGRVATGWDSEDLLALSDDEVWELRQTCARFGLLCFRRVGGMTAERFGRFMARWGAIERDYDVHADSSLDPSAPVDVAPAVFGNGGEGEHLYADTAWHFDGEDLPWLHSYTSLFCLHAPHAGHSTAFAATSAAASHLPAELFARLDGAHAQYSSFDIGNVEVEHDDHGPQLKPILRRHKHFG
eukprot:COSAG02_NODE_4808_length_4955_cov_3.563633_5_plen_281_part_00